ncbi:hypothetical protein FQN54_004705 [Arachnomyces sp. PD_36]|nr:hypothetical protein FQN54_004705 [Arachnomyces sp. PD_36]
MDPSKVMTQGFWEREGKKLVTVSANDYIREDLRNEIRKKMKVVVDIVELDFQPTDDGVVRRRTTASTTV